MISVLKSINTFFPQPIDLEETMDRGLRRRTSRTGRRNLVGIDLDDVEDAVRSMQQDTQDIRTEFVSFSMNFFFFF